MNASFMKGPIRPFPVYPVPLMHLNRYGMMESIETPAEQFAMREMRPYNCYAINPYQHFESICNPQISTEDAKAIDCSTKHRCDIDPEISKKQKTQSCYIGGVWQRYDKVSLGYLRWLSKCNCACQLCAKEFSSLAHLNRHMKIHTGEKPFKCYQCGRDFRDPSNLQRHLKNIHGVEKPYSCMICFRSFGQISTLCRHLAQHN